MNTLRKLGFLFVVILVIAGCREIRDAELGEPFSKVEGLVATPWELTSISLVDGADPARTSRDFGEFFLNGDSVLTLEFFEDGTFIANQGEGLAIIPDGGTWSFDDVNYPTKIILNPGAEQLELQLEGPTRIVDTQLLVRYDKYFCVLEEGEPEVPVLSYEMDFQRVN